MITQDLITEILLKLPVKSLLRCKAVCKPWLSLISNPNFIKSHLKHTLTNLDGADQTVIVYETDDNTMSLLNLKTPQVEPPLPLGFPFSKGEYSFDPDYKIVGTYNGIVCVSVANCSRAEIFNYPAYSRNFVYLNNQNTYIWNPATKQVKLVPPHNIRKNVVSKDIGFGFDPMSNDFKVVRVVRFHPNFFDPLDKPFAAEVYSVNTNIWREVDPIPADYRDGNDFNVCVNGFLCCGGSRGMTAFDLDREMFTCGINLPATSSSYCITDFNHCIAVITSMEGELDRIFQLWTLDNESCLRGGGVEALWTVMLTVNVNFPNPRVFGCFNSGDFVLYTDDHVCLLYDSHKKEARIVPVSIRRIIRYNESLVSITGSKPVHWNVHEDDRGLM